MKIHKVELESVRNIRHISLDLSAPVTIIAGRRGVQKSTIQQAILAAMFPTSKKDRDCLISHFDSDSKPRAKLFLSRGSESPTITLLRTLTDDSGEWREGSKIIKQKGKALEMVQKTLPISADAAALLLWGRQEEMGKVLAEFPEDGYSLLTAATVKGGGPDPQDMIALLEKQIKEVTRGKRGGQDPGSLTQAKRRVNDLKDELKEDHEAEKQREELQKKHTKAKADRSQLQKSCRELEQQTQHLECLEELIETAVQLSDKLSDLEKQQEELDTFDEQIKTAQSEVADLKQDLNVLQVQYRVAKAGELDGQIKGLKTQIGLVEEAQEKVAQIRKDLGAKKRPDSNDVKQLQQLQREIEKAFDRMEASGVRYELSAESGEHTVEISEDNDAPEQQILSAGETHQGIVGQVVIQADGLRISASGKEDVAGHKRTIEQTEKKLSSLFQQFGVKNENGFSDLADERASLERDLKKAESNMETELKGETLGSLKAEMAQLEEACTQNKLTQKDKEICAEKHLWAASKIEKDVIRKQGELETAQKTLRKLEQNKPNDSDKGQIQKDLRTARKEADHAASEFKEDDEEKRDPSPELLTGVRNTLRTKRGELTTAREDHSEADKLVTGLASELKYAGPNRPLSATQADLEDARAKLHREEVFQKAREMVRDRIQTKVYELAESVPSELAGCISRYMERLTNGIYERVHLTDDLKLDRVRERDEDWKPQELSVSERTMTALTVKIAVARSLAEMSDPVFIILDDSLVNLGPDDRMATENLLLDVVADGKLQVILLTCHTDWAEDWYHRTQDGIRYIELEKTADYYRTPAVMALS